MDLRYCRKICFACSHHAALGIGWKARSARGVCAGRTWKESPAEARGNARKNAIVTRLYALNFT
jgi:hypothetical protein